MQGREKEMIMACSRSPESKLLCRKQGEGGGLSWLSTGWVFPTGLWKGMHQSCYIHCKSSGPPCSSDASAEHVLSPGLAGALALCAASMQGTNCQGCTALKFLLGNFTEPNTALTRNTAHTGCS